MNRALVDCYILNRILVVVNRITLDLKNDRCNCMLHLVRVIWRRKRGINGSPVGHAANVPDIYWNAQTYLPTYLPLLCRT